MHALILTVLLAAPAFEAHTYESMPYRLLVPENYDRKRSYPLVLWLHGGAGRGTDNVKQIRGGNELGATVWTRAKTPAFVVAPQSPEGTTWTPHLPRVMALLQELTRTYNIDRERIYAAGQSMGGYAVWELVARYPASFAAAVPLCGGGDVRNAPKLVSTPLWAFHGAHDRAVPVERSREMIAAIRRAGGKPRYTEYSDVDHVVWTRAFREPELLPWVFSQVNRRASSASRR
ncbi:MAG TPA: prolyl oligopeptidase family serine peptidase [Thermoanaerobaculia bacterium]|nr:prolyl oligopeptidase family serine peptidase [Thermoanaerobaculia bacterium]